MTDPRGFTELTRPVLGRLLQAARALCGDSDLAAELVQVALVRGFRSWDTFEPGAPVYPWLARILRNAFIDHLRSARVRHEVPMADDLDPPVTSTPLDAVLARERAETLYAAIAELPPDYALAITLVDLQGLEYVEAAEVAGVPVGTVRSRLSRARSQLRAILLTR